MVFVILFKLKKHRPKSVLSILNKFKKYYFLMIFAVLKTLPLSSLRESK